MKYDNLACAGRNEIGSFGSGNTYEACQAICDADDTCVSFEFTVGGTCMLSTSCVFAYSQRSDGYALFVKKGK